MPVAETGQICRKAGSYYCIEHSDHILKMEEGEEFPKCDFQNNPHDSYWILKIRNYKSITYEPREKSAWLPEPEIIS